jgi:hypothetical protein
MEGQLFFPWAMTIPGIKHVFDNMTGDMLNKLNRVSKPFKSSFTDRDRLKQRLLRPTWKGRFQLRLSNMAAPANGGFLKRGDPKIIHFIGFSKLSRTIQLLGYHHLWKPPDDPLSGRCGFSREGGQHHRSSCSLAGQQVRLGTYAAQILQKGMG